MENRSYFDCTTHRIPGQAWFSRMGMVKFEFVAQADVAAICRMVSEKRFK